MSDKEDNNMTDILNNEKKAIKAIKEISADQIGNVSGGFIYLNKDTGMYEVINDKTWETVICVKDERSARVCCNAKGFNTSRASKSVLEDCRKRVAAARKA